jgi:hypothetical protein
MLYALYRLGYHGRATVHGFRASASTMLNELAFDPDVVERQLAHQKRNKVRAAYHRAEYIAERRTMMQRWADYVDEISSITGAAVLGRRAFAGSTFLCYLQAYSRRRCTNALATYSWHDIRNDGVGGSNPSCGTSTFYQFGTGQEGTAAYSFATRRWFRRRSDETLPEAREPWIQGGYTVSPHFQPTGKRQMIRSAETRHSTHATALSLSARILVNSHVTFLGADSRHLASGGLRPLSPKSEVEISAGTPLSTSRSTTATEPARLSTKPRVSSSSIDRVQY